MTTRFEEARMSDYTDSEPPDEEVYADDEADEEADRCFRELRDNGHFR